MSRSCGSQRQGQKRSAGLPSNGLIVYGNGVVYGGNECPGVGNGMYMPPSQQVRASAGMAAHPRHKSVGPPVLHTAQRAQARVVTQRAASLAHPSRVKPQMEQHHHQQQQQQQQRQQQQLQQQQMAQQQAYGNWQRSCTATDNSRYLAMMQQQLQMQQQFLRHQQLQLQAALLTGQSYNPYNNYHQQSIGDSWGGYAMMEPMDINKPYTFG
ncbi:hypothetical protein KR018_007886 [Drosophila ironensis]|nr:hypothetical protein KR018_007886 [Drosophila ironensis]